MIDTGGAARFDDVSNTEATVLALRKLVIFGADQSGAYRELFGPIALQLGSDIATRLHSHLTTWAHSAESGLVVLTGNAGTGKTAAVEHFCMALGADLPSTDDLVPVGDALVAKDVSGMATRGVRATAFRMALVEMRTRKVLLCANEGVLRDAVEDLAADYPHLDQGLTHALGAGAWQQDGLTIINVNRQRLTSSALWNGLLDFVSREDLWSGCIGCPGLEAGTECPMRANAAALREGNTREAIRILFQTASVEAVPTIREMLAILAYAICGDASGDAGPDGMWTCALVRQRYRDRGANAFTGSSGYYSLIFGAGLPAEVRERSPLLNALERLRPGSVADLEVDGWLRDCGAAPMQIRALAGAPGDDGDGLLSGTRSVLDRVRTAEGEMTYYRLGEIVSISEDPTKVAAGMKVLVGARPSGQEMWRRRVLLEGSDALGGVGRAVSRLTAVSHAPSLIALANKVANNQDVVAETKQIVRGLNFLVTGYADASEGLIVPEPASLFARNPGSFRPAKPAFVNAKVPADRLRLEVPDRGHVDRLLDVDHVEVQLVVAGELPVALTIGPRLYQIIREAEEYRGPVGHGTAEMTALRSFYGRLVAADYGLAEPGLLVADPARSALVRIQLPHFAANA